MWKALKRCIRFLLKHTRCIQSFERQDIVPKQITCFSDSKFAGSLQSRKSTSSCKITHGKHLLKSTSTTQAVVSFSSAEAEFYATVKPAADGNWLRFNDARSWSNFATTRSRGQSERVWGDGVDSPSFEIKPDATAGRAIAMRRGAGRIRHIATPTLWLQRLVINGDI